MKFKQGDLIKTRHVPDMIVLVLNIKDHWAAHKTTEPGYELIILKDPRWSSPTRNPFKKYGIPESLAILEYDLASSKPSETPKDNK